MLAFGGHQGGIRRSRSTWLLLALLATTPACGEDFGSDPPPGPSEETWSRSFGDASTQRVNAVAVDAMGAVFVTGSFSGTTDFGGGPLDAAGNDTDLFVAKYDTNGDHLWSRRFGDSSRQSGLAIAVVTFFALVFFLTPTLLSGFGPRATTAPAKGRGVEVLTGRLSVVEVGVQILLLPVALVIGAAVIVLVVR